MAITANFELGSNGSNILVADPGSATAWDVVDTTAGPLTYDNTHSYQTLSGKVAASGAAASILSWTTAYGTQTDHYGRIYFYSSGVSNYIRLIQFINVGLAARIGINGSLKINTSGSGGVGGGTMTNSIATGQWIRIEWHIVHSATVGIVEVKLFNNPDSASPTETLTTSSMDTQVQSVEVDFGWGSGGSSSETFWMDSIVAAATSYPGPIPGTSAPGDDPPIGFLGRGAGW